MSTSFRNRHALEDHVPGFSSFPNANHVSILRRPAVIRVLGRPAGAVDVAERLAAMVEVSVRTCGPFVWLALSDTRSAESLLEEAARRGIDRQSALDASDGCVVMRITGPDVRRILGKCVAVDLHPDCFPEGRSGNLMIARVSANLARLAGDHFEIVTDRSNAAWVFEELLARGREFQLSAGFAD